LPNIGICAFNEIETTAKDKSFVLKE